MSTVSHFLITHPVTCPHPNGTPACGVRGWRAGLGSDAGGLLLENMQVDAGILAGAAAAGALTQCLVLLCRPAFLSGEPGTSGKAHICKDHHSFPFSAFIQEKYSRRTLFLPLLKFLKKGNFLDYIPT